MLSNSIGGFVLTSPEADKIGFVWLCFCIGKDPDIFS
jgi:hypothetical protein